MIDPAAVLARVAARFGVSVADLIGPRRFRRLAPARQAAAAVLRARGMGVREAGEALQCNHTTITYYVAQAAARAAADPRFAADLAALLADERAPAPRWSARPADQKAYDSYVAGRLFRHYGGFPFPESA